MLLFTIQSKMRANNQKPYTPREGKMLADINRAWESLERAEHERELALRDELIRLTHHLICIGGGAYWAGRAAALPAHFSVLVGKAYSLPTHFLWLIVYILS